ncbi:MAG: PTS sugar transporter subunit IIB [Candidatus Nanopelagicales bacterium]|jgi:PTS system ascorbate-specific IIB component|nr:PTS sugar transporter subunit IIB [Candidatus Nanopelagicales bacterium]
MKSPMRIASVCSMGIGTAVLLKMNVDKVLERLGIPGVVEAVDVSAARGAAREADLVLTNADMVGQCTGQRAMVRVIHDFMNLDEIAAVILDARSA